MAEINRQVSRYYYMEGKWPANDLSDIGANPDYFPGGLPACPIDGTQYELAPDTHKVSGHVRGEGSHKPEEPKPDVTGSNIAEILKNSSLNMGLRVIEDKIYAYGGSDDGRRAAFIFSKRGKLLEKQTDPAKIKTMMDKIW